MYWGIHTLYQERSVSLTCNLFLGLEGDVDQQRQSVSAVRDWSVPTTIKELKHFLWFAHFYHWIMFRFSNIIGHLLKNKAKCLHWNHSTDQSFLNKRLKWPILKHPGFWGICYIPDKFGIRLHFQTINRAIKHLSHGIHYPTAIINSYTFTVTGILITHARTLS